MVTSSNNLRSNLSQCKEFSIGEEMRVHLFCKTLVKSKRLRKESDIQTNLPQIFMELHMNTRLDLVFEVDFLWQIVWFRKSKILASKLMKLREDFVKIQILTLLYLQKMRHLKWFSRLFKTVTHINTNKMTIVFRNLKFYSTE